MSLLIVGSCSRITSNIIHAIASTNKYQTISIADPLPSYSFHQRYYRLRKQLDEHQSSVKVGISKLIQIQQLSKLTQDHQDVLYVTHDYYHQVISKLKLMELTAESSKNKSNVYFATPVEYDNFSYDNPEQIYQISHKKIRQICPQATLIRSDVQDGAETSAYIKASKNIIDQKWFSFHLTSKFRPRVVSSGFFAKFVANVIVNKTTAKDYCLTGKQEITVSQIKHNTQIQLSEICHIKGNVANLVSKSSGVIGQGSELIQT